MSALAREIGSRGRADAVVPVVTDELSSAEAGSDVDALRAELSGLRLKELRSRAKAEGAEPQQLDDAADAEDPKTAVIELLLALRADAAGLGGESDDATLRAELSGLRLKELRQRARERGIGAEALEEAADSEEPKAAVVELLLRAPKQ